MIKDPAFVKISAAGDELPIEAVDWAAVRDETTGLTWAREPITVDNWTKATEERVASELATSRLAGMDGWRIPTRRELVTLVDDTRHSPAIDTTFFPETASDWFWTSTVAAPSPGDCAWYVNFGYGRASWFYRSSDGFVRAVRASQ